MNDIKLEIHGVEFRIEYEFDRGSPMVRYYPDGSGDPGSDPEVSICKIELEVRTNLSYRYIDFTDFFEELPGEIEKMEEEIMNQLIEQQY